MILMLQNIRLVTRSCRQIRLRNPWSDNPNPAFKEHADVWKKQMENSGGGGRSRAPPAGFDPMDDVFKGRVRTVDL